MIGVEEKHMKQKSLKLNVIMNMILTMSSFIFPLITFPYVSRILLPDGIGKISFATSLISYFTMFAQLGIPTYGIRACAKVRDNREELTRTAQELLIINLVMSAISYVVLFLAISFVPRLQSERTLYVIVSFNIILTSIGMEWLYKALEQYTYITIRSVIFKLVALISMFLLIHEKSDYVIYGGISILAASASNIFNFINVHKYIDLKPIGGYNFRRHLKPIGTFFVMACATTIYTNLDTVMLGFMKTDADVGYYNAAVKIKNILVSIVASLGAVILPRASYYVENGLTNEFRRITKKALSFVFLIAPPLMLYFIFYAKEGIFFLSGNAYEGSILPMQIIMPTLLFIGITNILGIQMLVPMGKEKVVLYSEIAGAIVDIIINAILIPRYASAGAAVGTLVAEFVVLIVQYIALKDDVTETLKQIHYGRITIALMLGTVSSLWVKMLGLGSFLTLMISTTLFFGVYGLFLLICKEEMIVEIWNMVVGKVLHKSNLNKQKKTKNKNTTLLIMAAGIGSRFGTGIKQLESVDASNHIIMDYSIHDAIEAGFNHVVFIIRKDIEKEFKEVIGDRIERVCEKYNVTVDYAFQDINDIPGTLPEGRTKPWGTGQAVLAAKKVITTPFIVINADDYYGKGGFKAVHEYLVNGGKSCMVGFVLKNTLSDNGSVTRGICKMDADNNLTEAVETKNIVKTENGAEADGVVIDTDSLVSMNMWGLTPDFLDVLEEGFKDFFEKEVAKNPLKAEYLIPTFIGELLEQGNMTVKVLKSNDTWYGMTYKEDVAAVKDSFKKMLEKGMYKADLFSDLPKPN